MKYNILVLSAGGPAGKALTKCISEKENIRVVCADCNLTNLEFVAPYSDKNYVIVSATNKNYINDVCNIIKKEKIDFLFAQNDKEIEVLSANRDKLTCKYFLPEHSIIKICQDKEFLFKVLTHNIPEPGDFKKHKYVWVRSTKGAGGKGSYMSDNNMDIASWKELNPEIKDWQVSEYLPGKNVGVDIFMKDGKVLAYFMKERLKYLPGASMSGVTGSADIIKIIDNKLILDIAVDALRTLDLKISGVFGVDLKEDSEGVFKITEINPGRFLTSSLIAFYLIGYSMPKFVIYSILSNNYDKYNKYKYVDYKVIRQVDSLPRLIK